MKKAQGLSLNTIIIAAIVLIVMVVLWAIFTGRMGGFNKGLGEVETCKSACEALGKTQAVVGDTENVEGIGPVGDVDNCMCKPKT